MASVKEDGTAAAAEQLGSMSLSESAGKKKDDGTEPTAKSGTTPTKLLCSACGKKSDALMKCRACKCVWYCDKDCQNKHWKEHKKECRPIMKELEKRGGKLDIGTELDVGPLGKLPPQDECPICMHALPLHESLHVYYSCCGKTLCCACEYQHSMKSGDQVTCAFCRTPAPVSDEDILARLHNRVGLNDSRALCNMAMMHGKGKRGLPVDQHKCIDLLRQSAGLGYPPAQFNLGNFYDVGEMGLEQNVTEALNHFKEAAEGGDIHARHNLACKEARKGNYIAAMRHARLSASGGLRTSVISLISGFDAGWLRHGDLAETLQAFYLASAEVKSEGRDKYIVHLKMIGEYEENMDA